jgi:hypothetical protein
VALDVEGLALDRRAVPATAVATRLAREVPAAVG